MKEKEKEEDSLKGASCIMEIANERRRVQGIKLLIVYPLCIAGALHNLTPSQFSYSRLHRCYARHLDSSSSFSVRNFRAMEYVIKTERMNEGEKETERERERERNDSKTRHIANETV